MVMISIQYQSLLYFIIMAGILMSKLANADIEPLHLFFVYAYKSNVYHLSSLYFPILRKIFILMFDLDIICKFCLDLNIILVGSTCIEDIIESIDLISRNNLNFGIKEYNRFYLIINLESPLQHYYPAAYMH